MSGAVKVAHRDHFQAPVACNNSSIITPPFERSSRSTGQLRVTSKWLCLDCSKDLLAPGADYHSIKNELLRQIVPRTQRHSMLCHGCIQRRLGRALKPEGFYQRSEAVDSDDPLSGPMTLEDYGILDDLRVPSLTPVDL
jgi:hypothetical protein